MNRLAHAHNTIAPRDGVGAAWLDSGLTPGLVVVDANRPAAGASSRPTRVVGNAGGLLTQFIATH
jgi:hypothetical protein